MKVKVKSASINVNRILLVCIFVSAFLNGFFPVTKYIYLAASSMFYLCMLIDSKGKTGKIDVINAILCTMTLLWVYLESFFSSPYVTILGMVIIYSFMSRSYWTAMHKINWFVIIYGSVAISLRFLNIYMDTKYLDWCIWGLQLVIVFKFLDPILEAIGQEKRRKRLAAEAALNEAKENLA